jgi:hypothetical protein
LLSFSDGTHIVSAGKSVKLVSQSPPSILNTVADSPAADGTINSGSNVDAALDFVAVFPQAIASVKLATQLVGCSFKIARQIIQTIFTTSSVRSTVIQRSVKLPNKIICPIFDATNEIFNRSFVGVSPTVVSAIFSAVIIPVTPLRFGYCARNDEDSKKEEKRHCQASDSVG